MKVFSRRVALMDEQFKKMGINIKKKLYSPTEAEVET